MFHFPMRLPNAQPRPLHGPGSKEGGISGLSKTYNNKACAAYTGRLHKSCSWLTPLFREKSL